MNLLFNTLLDSVLGTSLHLLRKQKIKAVSLKESYQSMWKPFCKIPKSIFYLLFSFRRFEFFRGFPIAFPNPL